MKAQYRRWLTFRWPRRVKSAVLSFVYYWCSTTAERLRDATEELEEKEEPEPWSVGRSVLPLQLTRRGEKVESVYLSSPSAAALLPILNGLSAKLRQARKGSPDCDHIAYVAVGGAQHRVDYRYQALSTDSAHKGVNFCPTCGALLYRNLTPEEEAGL